MALYNEAKKLLGENAGYGSGWWNVRTGQRFQEADSPHAEVILDHAKEFGIYNDIPADAWNDAEKMSAIADRMDGFYDEFYDQGWLRYLWAYEHGESLLAGSSTPEVLATAWQEQIIHELYDDFQPTMSYWSHDNGRSPNVKMPKGTTGLPASLEDWFESLSDPYEINDIRRRAGIA